MRIEANIAPVAALFAEPSRAAIMSVLLDGRALPAGELANLRRSQPDRRERAFSKAHRWRTPVSGSRGTASLLPTGKHRRCTGDRGAGTAYQRTGDLSHAVASTRCPSVCVTLAVVMIISPENSRSPSPLLWKTEAGLNTERANVTSLEKRKG